VLPQLLVFFVSNAARVVAVLSKASLLTFGSIAALEILGSELALAAVYSFHLRNMSRWKFRKEKGLAMLRASWPLLIASLLGIVYMRTDQIVLGNLCSKAVVGQYASASRLSEIWYARLQRLYGMMVALSVTLGLLVTCFGKYVVLLLFGAAYLPAVQILRVHIWTGPFVFIGVVSGMQLVHEGLTRISLQRSVIGALANLALNYLLVPHFGGIGSALATLITQATVSYLLDAMNGSTRHIFWMKTRAISGAWLFEPHAKKAKLEAA